MSRKRITIYDLARELEISASYISRALNDHPSINKTVIERVKQKARELNYKHNSQAANLRQGSSNTIGVIVPHINRYFFSEAIAGIEEVCFKNNYSLIICQSHESFSQECKAIDTLIHQGVDCIMISISAETQSVSHLENIKKHNIDLIQFDRCLHEVNSYKVLNDNKDVSYRIVKILIEQGYRRIAFLGGPGHLTTFQLRKEGYLQAIREHSLAIPEGFIIEDVLSQQKATQAAKALMSAENPPDAFFTTSDHQSLGVWQVAKDLGIKVPQELGIFGFANEEFTPIIQPSLSSVDQRSKDLGKQAARIYFDLLLNKDNELSDPEEQIIRSEILIRDSSVKSGF